MDSDVVELRPAKGGEPWKLEFRSSIASLRSPDGRDVLTLPCEDIAAYMQLFRDLFRGWVVKVSVGEGLQSYTFSCAKQEAHTILHYLPHKSTQEVRKQVRLHGLLLALFGVFYWLLPDPFAWWKGAGLLAAGAVGLFYPRLRMHLAYGLLLFAVGISQLLASQAVAPTGPAELDFVYILSTVTAIVLFCLAVQQLVLLGAPAQVRSARVRSTTAKDDETTAVAAQLPLVRKVAVAAGVVGLAMWAYASVVICATWAGLPTGAWTPTVRYSDAALAEVVASSFLGVTCLTSGLFLLALRRPAYGEAKVTAQMLIVLVFVFLWGGVLDFDTANPWLVLGALMPTGIRAFARPYVWASLILALVLLNKWFERHLDRELKERSLQ